MVINTDNPKRYPIGNKATGLIALKQIGVPVPQFRTVLLHDLIADFSHQAKRIRLAFIAADFLQVAKLLEGLAWHEEILQKDFRALKSVFQKSTVSFRTSATMEDLAHQSFAGIYETYLDQDLDLETFQTHLALCYASLYSRRAHAYLKHHGLLENCRLSCSIIIQEMFHARFSGVAFMYPNKTQSSLVFGVGAGEHIVRGVTGTDITITCGSLIDPPKGMSDAGCTDSWQSLLTCLSSIMENAQVGQDIEWALHEKGVAFLQTRAITQPIASTLSHDSDIFDSTNITESYPGVTLPLTYSFIKTAYANVYASFLRLVGVPLVTIRRERSTLENLLGYIDGRVYYRIRNWYGMISLLPGYRFNKDFFEAMLVPKKNISSEENATIVKKKSSISLLGLITQIYLGATFVVKLVFYKRASSTFLKKFERLHKRHTDTDLDALTPNQIMQHYLTLRNEFFSDWKTPILNDFRVMIFHGILSKVLFHLSPKDAQTSLNILLSGYAETDNTLILADIRALITLISEDAVLHDLFHSEHPKEILHQIHTNIRFEVFKDRFDQYLDRYGSRRPGELKLEHLSLSQDPTILIKTLRLSLTSTKPVNVVKSLPEKPKPIDPAGSLHNPFKRYLYRRMIALCAHYAKVAIRERELFRFKRGQVFDIARGCFLALGTRFATQGVLTKREDIFYLTTDEVFSMANNDHFEKSFITLVEKRQKIYTSYINGPQPERRIERAGFGAFAIDLPDGDGITRGLSGQAVSPGTVTAPALVVNDFDPDADYQGKILITYHTDPGWTIIFPMLKGIILEKGNVLSHGAILSRELGLPCIVKADGITQKVQSGDIIQMDGRTGFIRIEQAYDTKP